MKHKKYKYDGRGTHRRALLHAIGQLEEINQSPVSVGQLMNFMGVSRPTAIKYLKRLEDRGEVSLWKEKHRGYADKYQIALNWQIRSEYIKRLYGEDYGVFVANRFGVQLP